MVEEAGGSSGASQGRDDGGGGSAGEERGAAGLPNRCVGAARRICSRRPVEVATRRQGLGVPRNSARINPHWAGSRALSPSHSTC